MSIKVYSPWPKGENLHLQLINACHDIGILNEQRDELLEALKYAVEEGESSIADLDPPWVRQALAVIAKAEGKE